MPFHVPLYDWVFLAIAGIGFVLLGAALMVPSRAVTATHA
jgi:hypothetical protein